MQLFKQGAEARLYLTEFLGKKCIVKERFKKSYRHPVLDKSLTDQRLKNELHGTLRCRQAGIHTPAVHYVDTATNAIYFEYLEDSVTLKEHVDKLLKEGDHQALNDIACRLGSLLAVMHNANIVHGDLTTSNILVRWTTGDSGSRDMVLYLIDFGLTTSPQGNEAEHKGVDLYVLERAFLSTHPNTESVFQCILDSYQKSCTSADKIVDKLNEVRLRGRKRLMVG